MKLMDRLCVRAGRPPKDQAQALGDHVVAVADSLFIERGYGGTSMAMVASLARVGKQTLYRRFPDKAALFREVIRRRIDEMGAGQGIQQPLQDPLEELRRLGRASLDCGLDPDAIRLYRVAVAEAAAFPELAASAADYWGSGFVPHCIDVIRRAQAMELCRPGDPERLANCFLWSVVGDPLHRTLSGQGALATEADRTLHFETAWQVFARGIAPSPADLEGSNAEQAVPSSGQSR